jgi:hypothetical protein
MAFSRNMPAAARRHLDAADRLGPDGVRKDVAGYLYGIAAECAIKAMMEKLPYARDLDAFYEHFPRLRTLLCESLRGRTGTSLHRLITNEKDPFLNNWDVKMRYSDGKGIRSDWILAWQEHARRAVSAMEG